MATFNILGFNQEKLMKVQQEKQINLNGNDLIVLRNIVDMIDSKRLEDKEINSKEYTWIKYSLLVDNLRFVSDKEDTFKKIITKLIKCELLDRKVLKSVGNGAYTYFRKTAILEKIEFVVEQGKKKNQSKKRHKKKYKDENVEILEGQIHVEEVIESEGISDRERVVRATKCTIERADEVLKYASDNNKNNVVGFSISAINKGWELNCKSIYETPKYDKLEAMLLGQIEYNQDDIEGVLSDNREHNYITNNSKRFKK